MIDVPESVLAYMQQPAIRTAVDLLLTGKEPKVPADLQWEEVSSFYRACLASRQVQAEFAMFTEELWRGVWDSVPPEWKPGAPSEPDRPDLAVDIRNIWNEGCFSRRFEQRGWSLELTVGLWPDTGLQVGVLLYDKRERPFFHDGTLEHWASEGFDTVWTQEHITSLGPIISLEPFHPWTEQAWHAISSALSGQ